MDPREERFRAKLEERGDHLVWTGAADRTGTGLVHIDGRLRTCNEPRGSSPTAR